MIDARGYNVAIASAILLALSLPASAQDAVPTAAATSMSMENGAPTLVDAPVPAPNASKVDAGIPAPAPEAVPGHIGKSTPATEAARQRRATRSQSKDVEADTHTPKPVQDAAEPEHFRGQITKVEASSIDVQTNDGQTVRLGFSDSLTILILSKGSFTTVDFGTYVGAAAVRLEEYSPIVRDSLSWLHRGFELRIIDEQLRGIAVGHKQWDLTPDSIIAHGWVDDMEARVLSIKWGPTEYEETDVEVGRDVPVLKMSLGDKSLIKPGAHVLAGAHKGTDGNYAAVFVFVGNDGIVPPL